MSMLRRSRLAALAAGPLPRILSVLLLVGLLAPMAAAQYTSTHSFTSGSVGSHPNTLTYASNNIVVDLNALTGTPTCYRAMLITQRGGNAGDQLQDPAGPLVQVESTDATGTYLSFVTPRKINLDCTAAVQRALAKAQGSRVLTLHVVSFPNLGSGSIPMRVDVWCDQQAASAVTQPTNLASVHSGGDTRLTFTEVNSPITQDTITWASFNAIQSALDSTSQIRYRIYRSTSPFTATSIRTATLVDEIPQLTCWDVGYYNGTQTDSSPITRFAVTDLNIVPAGTGIYVYRARASQSAYYAVSRVVDGQENLSTFTSGNALQSAVAESTGTGAVVLQSVQTPTDFMYVSNPTLKYYTRWECPPTYNLPSTPLDYLLAIPPTTVNPRPIDVALHCWGGSLNGGYGWWYNAENGYLMVATNQVPYDWWTGSNENYGTADSFNTGTVYNYQEQRITSFVENFIKTQYTVDSNRIMLSGVSMGGSGTSMWGLRTAGYFSYIDGWVGVHRPRYTPQFYQSFEGAYGRQAWARPYYLTGTDAFDYFDNVLWLNTNPAVETPYICLSNGKNDSAIGWQQAVDYINKLIEQRRPFKFHWDQSGHGCRAILPGPNPSDRYCGLDIAKNQPLPAFTHCSLDNVPGTGDPANGDATGDINAYQVWETTGWVDTATEFQMTCSLIPSAPQSSCTTDFTPRRCQSFLLTAGTNCAWQNTDVASSTVVQSGNITADSLGLVTITGLTVSKTGNRVKITKGSGGGDTTAPAAVANLAAGSPTSSSLTLTWTAPGDDGNTGTATSYDIRYSTSTINSGNWSSATQVSGEPTPQVAGTNQSMTISGLSAGTTYYFAIKTSDEVPNISALSNVPSGTTSAAADTTPPAAVANLAAGSATTTSLTLTWTAPGDDGNTGTATSYDIRYSTATINDANWASATQVAGEPTPQVAGTNQSMTISGLTASTTYYFAIKTSDEVPNVSALSNIASGTTSTSGGGGSGQLVLQQNLSSYAGVTDSFFEYFGGNEPYYTYGGLGFIRFWDTVDQGGGRKIVLRFDLSDLSSRLPAGAQITAATLALYQYGTEYANATTTDSVAIYKMKRAWVEGTGQDYGSNIDGASFYYANAPVRNPTSWTQNGTYTNVWQLDVASATIDHCQNDMALGAGDWVKSASLLEVSQGTMRWWQSGSTLYVNKDGSTTTNPTASNRGFGYYLIGDRWQQGGATGDNDVDKPTKMTVSWLNYDQNYDAGNPGALSGPPNWVTADITSWVTGWQSSPSTNFGIMIAENMVGSNYSRTEGRFFRSSEYDAGGGNYTYGPKLTLDYIMPDTTPPAAINNLATSNPTTTSITLTWTAPGDDGSTGTATSYDIRYSTSTINDSNWASATQVTGEPAPQAAGTNQSMAITGLSSNTTYYFAIKTSDEVPNTSALSNIASGTTADGIAPAAVSNLATSSPTGSTITLTWTAPGDDGNTGTATSYDIRYSTSTITTGNWASATQVTGEPAPQVAGTNQSMTITGLSTGTTYYFAMTTSDEVPNTSALSNVASGTTTTSTITFVNNILTYGSVSDLDSIIDPAGLNDVAVSYGVSKASFQALNPKVVAFNGAPPPGTSLNQLVAYYTATNTVSFTFGTPYNYGSYTSYGRGGFSGTSYQDAISTAPVTNGGITDWFDATITSTGGQGVIALGFCVCFRNDQAVDAGQAIFTLNDGTTGSVTLPALGNANPRLVFIGYQAPTGKTITRVQASHTSTVGGAWVAVDDLSFVMGTPADIIAPAAVANLAAGSPTSGSLTLTWTAPGDDGSTGTATSYDIRYSTSTINDANFASATAVTGVPAPAAAGTNQNVTVSGLAANTTYYFAMKTSDEVPNVSAISNIASGTTSAPSIPPVTVKHIGGNTSGWRGGYNISTTYCFVSNWPNSNADAEIGEFDRTALQSAIDTIYSAYRGWDARMVLSQVNWNTTQPPTGLTMVAGSADLDRGTVVWQNGNAFGAGNGNWTFNGTGYSDFATAVSAGTASGRTVVVSGMPYTSVWDTDLPSACWDIIMDVPESLINTYMQNPTALGLFASCTDATGLVVHANDQWSHQANVRIVIQQPPQTAPWIGLNTYAVNKTIALTGPTDSQVVNVTNAGTGTLNWTATENPDVTWLSIASGSGTNSGSFTANFNVTGLTAGNTYTTKIRVAATGAANTPQDISVSVKVVANASPTIQLSPTSLSYDMAPTDAAQTQTVTVTNAGMGTLNWTAAESPDVNWITLSGASGTAGQAFSVIVNPSGLTPGTYSANIQVTAPGATNTPQTVPVSLSVRERDSDITKANSYDDAWETGASGWVQHCTNIMNAWSGKNDGFVVHVGDSITYAAPYGSWARYGNGKTTADVNICSWMHSNINGDGTNNTNSGWWLTYYDVPGRGGSYTAKSGIRADQYLAGNYSLPSTDQMFTSGFTNPDGKQYRDAEICVLMLGTNDVGAGRTSAAFIADLGTIIDKMQAANVIVAVSTLPPRNGFDTAIADYNTQIRSLAQTKAIPLIDFYQEVVRRRPNGTWMNTLISSDGVHPSSDYGSSHADSDPYANGGGALSDSGYLLRDWLSVQKIQEIKSKVITGATTWNVSTTAQLQNAVASYAPGDSIVLAAGTYTPTSRLTMNRGAVTVRGATGNRDDVVIQGPGMTVNTEPTEMFDLYCDDVTIKDLTIKEVYYHGVHIRGEMDVDRTHIQNVHTINCGERHFKSSFDNSQPGNISDDVLIENCLCEQTQPNSNHTDNDYIAGIDFMGVNNVIIRNNVFHGIKGPTGGGRAAIFIWHHNTNPTIEGNKIYDCDRGISMSNPGWAGPGPASTGGILRNNFITRGVNIALELNFSSDLKVYYNTIYSDDATYWRTVSIYDDANIFVTSNLQLKYNIIRGVINNGSAGSGNVTETGDITGSAPATNWFTNSAIGDLHLTASATGAFNAGVLLTEVPTDIDGEARDSTPDVGADQTTLGATPTVQFQAASSSGPETTTSVNIPVTLSASSGQTVTVNYAVTGGTAVQGTDFTISGTSLTFNPGVTTQNIPVTIINDARYGPNDTIILTLSSPTNATLGTNTTCTYTILDTDDSAPTVQFSSATGSGSESVTSVNIPVTLSAASEYTTTVNYAVTGGTATGGGVDYTLTSGTLTFNPGVTSQNIAMTVVNDSLNEANETVIVTLSSPTNATLGTNATYTYTIIDNDPVPTVAFSSATGSGSESVTSVTIPVTLSAASGQTVTVNYAVTGGTATGAGVDYTLTSGTLTFNPGVTSQNIAMTVVDDTIAESNETVIITLSSPSNATLGANTTYTYTIMDNDTAPTFVAAGAVASGTGAITPALPSGLQANDILLLFLETANQAISITNQNGGTWTQVTNSPQGTGTAGGTAATCLTAFWSRYNGTQGAPTTSDSGDHQLGRMIAIRGATTSGNPWDVTAGGVDATSSTSGSIPGATTTVANTLVVVAIATSLPDASSTANFSGWTNAALSSLTERTDNAVTAGNGGGLAIATGGKATAGAYGATAVTLANAAQKGMMSIAIKH